MRCGRCETENPKGARFCEECGARLETACPACGATGSPERKFCGSCGQALTERVAAVAPRFEAPERYTPPHIAEKIRMSLGGPSGERKRVTVLFADIKDSLELIEGSDPEEAQTILDSVIAAMMDAIHRYEGTVNKVLGDGVMALFGAPLAHEDHAVRACYAALAMQEAMARYTETMRRERGLEIRARVGLHSGEVVVRTIRNDLSIDYDAIGQTTHLAARMEQLATPGTIRLTADTVRLAEDFVDVKPLGPMPVKGLTEPLQVFELIGARRVRTRIEAAAARGLTRFVGRRAEIEALSRSLEQAGAGRGQIVAVVGEPGVGKSRLYYEFTRSHRTEGWLILETSSVSYGKAIPYLPVVGLLKDYFKIEERDDKRRIGEKVAGKLVMLDEAFKAALPAFLSLLDVPVERSDWSAVDPAQRRRRILDAVTGLLLRESEIQPLIVVSEDLHWIDTETQALLDGLIERLPEARLLLMVNYRPEFQHDWRDRPNYTEIAINPLPPESAEQLLEALLGADAGLIPLKRLLIERTGGNPFFLEESVRTLAETGALGGTPGTYRLTKDVEAIKVPATVQAILAARIDRLPQEDKDLLQTAAVVGKELNLSLLLAVAERSGKEQLLSRLSSLQGHGFIYETSLYPEPEYTFRHALTHEVAYGGVLQERRRALHKRILQAIERLHRDRLAEQVEQLAHHAVKGEVWDKAFVYLAQKGERSYRVHANDEALAAFTQALEMSGSLPETAENRTQRIALTQRLGVIHALLGRYGDSLPLFSSALELAERAEDKRSIAQLETRIGGVLYMQGDIGGAVSRLEKALDLARRIPDETMMAFAYQNLGHVHVTSGRLPDAIDNYRNALDLSERSGNHKGIAAALTMLSNAYNRAGRFEDTLACGRRALSLGEQLNDDRRIAWSAIMLGWRHIELGELDAADYLLEKARHLGDKVGDVQAVTWVRIHQAVCMACRGNLEPAIDELQTMIRMSEKSGALQQEVSFALTRLGEYLLRAGRFAEALDCCRQSLDAARRKSSKIDYGYASMILGELHATPECRDAETADRCLDESVKAFREVGAESDLGRAHLARARIYRQRHDAKARAEASAAREIFSRIGNQILLNQVDSLLEDLRQSA